MEFTDFIKDGIIVTNLKASSKKEVFKMLYDKLYENKNVKESFYAGVVEREEQFPTGLLLNKYNVAIPHTDAKHVLKSSIAIATLEEPVTFQCMDDENMSIEVRIVFMLALGKAHSHVEMLQKIILMIQNDLILENILNAKNKEDLFQLIVESN